MPLLLLGGGLFQFQMQNQGYFAGLESMSGLIGWNAGIGVGRVIDVKPVAKAVAVARKLDLELSNDQIIAVARVIGMQEEYKYRFRGEYEGRFFEDVASALGQGNNIMEVRRALLDSAWISPRLTDWSVSVRYRQGYSLGAMSDGADMLQPSYLDLRGELGMPIALNAQLSPSLIWTIPLSDAQSSEGNFNAYFYVDHSTNWRSYFGGSVTTTFLKEGDPSLEVSLLAGTGAGFLERLYWDFSIEYTRSNDDNNVHTALFFGFQPDFNPKHELSDAGVVIQEPLPPPPPPKPEDLSVLANDPVKFLTGATVALQQHTEETETGVSIPGPVSYGGGAYAGLLLRAGYYVSLGATVSVNLYVGEPIYSVAPELMLMIHPPRSDITALLATGVAMPAPAMGTITVGMCIERHLIAATWMPQTRAGGIHYAYVW